MQTEEVKLKDILAISGKPGLYKFLSQGRNSIIVESFTDGKRISVQSNTKVSALEDIAIYTETEEVPLKEVFKTMVKFFEGKQTISHKSQPDELKDLFSDILPEYDKERVYVSDIKKVINWYNALCELDLFSKGILEDEESKDSEAEENIEEKKPEQSAPEETDTEKTE